MKNQNKFQRFFNFENIGTKIKNFTKWYCWVSIVLIWIASAVMFLVGCSDDWLAEIYIPISLVSALVMPWVIWLSSWMVYAFGELVEKTTSIDRKIANVNGEVKSETQAKIDNERIAKLEKLRADGFITEEEYQQALQQQNR